jgi:hypothetical protein
MCIVYVYVKIHKFIHIFIIIYVPYIIININIYIYIVASCITYFTFYQSQTGSRVSVGVGSWSEMLEDVGSNHLCVYNGALCHTYCTEFFGNFPHLFGICEISHK